MNRFKKVFLATLCFTIIVLITGCGKKKISIDKFNKKMTNEGFTISDIGSKEEDGVKKSNMAVDSNNVSAIIYYEFDKFENAKKLFNSAKEKISKLAVKGATSGTINRKKYLKYVLTNNDYYYVLSTIDNTMIYGVTKVENKNELKNLIKSLGY